MPSWSAQPVTDPEQGKVRAIAARAAQLARRARIEGACVAVSMNSYAQIVAGRFARIPAVTLMDYEFQPANHGAFRLAQRIVVPAVFRMPRLIGSGHDAAV